MVARVSQLKDARRPHIIFEIFHVCINIHHAVSLSSFIIPKYEYLSKLSWNIMEHLPTSPSPMPWSTDAAHWALNGANVVITSNCACMHRNLTWLDKTHAFMVWDGFKAQGCMSFMHNVWYRPHFHQCSSCSFFVIFFHSHQRNIFQHSLEMSRNIFQ